MMATSKENIFAHSDEIEVRKQIKNELYEFIGTLNEEQKEILSVQSSLIESVYRYRSDFYSADDDISCQDFLTRREQEIPHLYRWWDELRLTRRFLTLVSDNIII